MNDRDCLTCKYEPEWGPVTKGDYPRCSGACKWNDPMPVTPKAVRVLREPILRYVTDNSGIHTNCRAWQPKVAA